MNLWVYHYQSEKDTENNNMGNNFFLFIFTFLYRNTQLLLSLGFYIVIIYFCAYLAPICYFPYFLFFAWILIIFVYIFSKFIYGMCFRIWVNLNSYTLTYGYLFMLFYSIGLSSRDGVYAWDEVNIFWEENPYTLVTHKHSHHIFKCIIN